jgi:hypothetical protein
VNPVARLVRPKIPKIALAILRQTGRLAAQLDRLSIQGLENLQLNVIQ